VRKLLFGPATINRMSSARKLQEAQFFIELLHALEERGESLTHGANPESEASFLYAAILNAFYSVISVMKEAEGADVSVFTSQHPAIYAHGSKGGERAKTVHLKHVEVAQAGYVPPPGGNLVLTIRRTPKLAPPRSEDAANLVLRLVPYYYFSVELLGRDVRALEFCEEHLQELRAFHAAQTSSRATAP
jgi:hypothetical protein